METQPVTKDIVVLYHAPCADGFSSAWVAWKKFGDEANYIPMKAGSAAPDNIENKEVYCIDYVPEENSFTDFVSKNKSVFVIDHHASNEQRIRAMDDFRFDIKKCGSVLAWEYFFPDEPVPLLLKYVQDVDIWTWQLANSNEISLYTELTEESFEARNKLVAEIENDQTRADIIKQASLLVKYKDKDLKGIIEAGKQLVEFEGIKMYAVNSATSGSFIGNTLVRMLPPVAIVWAEHSNAVRVSLRSNGDFDVTKLAGKYGGGGHAAAAGFRLPLGSEKPWKVIKHET